MDLKFLKWHRWLCISTFELLVLGSAVRVLKAGLACPDWPLCFGAFIPDFHPQVYLEFIHRALAGLIGIGVLGLHGYLIWRRPRVSGVALFSWMSFLLLGLQINLGKLTVIWQLQPQVVTAHLGCGAALFATMVWIHYKMRGDLFPADSVSQPVAARIPRATLWWGAALPLAIYAQVLLGGTVASNFAALVCTDFPYCHGQFIPTLHGIIGLQIIHRLGAYALFLLVLSFFLWTNWRGLTGEIRKRSQQLMVLVAFQVVLGIANVVYLNPPIITVLHLATAMLMLAVALRILFLGQLLTEPSQRRNYKFERAAHSASGCLEGSELLNGSSIINRS